MWRTSGSKQASTTDACQYRLIISATVTDYNVSMTQAKDSMTSWVSTRTVGNPLLISKNRSTSSSGQTFDTTPSYTDSDIFPSVFDHDTGLTPAIKASSSIGYNSSSSLVFMGGKFERCYLHTEHCLASSYNRKAIYYSSRIIPAHMMPIHHTILWKMFVNFPI